MMVLKKPIIGILVLLMTINWSCQNTPKVKNKTTVDYLKESKEDFDQRMNWWREARFGMFIHWGVYAVPAGIHNGFKTKGIGEWIQRHAQISIADYEKYAKQFNPIKYDAEEWAKLMKKSRYEIRGHHFKAP